MAVRRGVVRLLGKAAGLALAIAGMALLSACASRADGAHASEEFFDDFSAPDLSRFADAGWSVRVKRGHPGIEGAAWGGADAVQLIDDPERTGNRLLRLNARTDGTTAGTVQSQVCQARKFFEGTYAARVRFADAPAFGPDGDVIVETFYAVAPLRFDFDPQYSEIDWEYLPNGGWEDPRTRLYGITWQTVRIDPWLAFNQPHQEFRSMAGWHTLMMTVADGRTRLFIDGDLRAEHGGRNTPVVPMSINFSLWFSPNGLVADAAPRVYREDVDWVLHVRNQVLTPQQVDARVDAFRAQGRGTLDTVPPASPPLASPCDF